MFLAHFFIEEISLVQASGFLAWNLPIALYNKNLCQRFCRCFFSKSRQNLPNMVVFSEKKSVARTWEFSESFQKIWVLMQFHKFYRLFSFNLLLFNVFSPILKVGKNSEVSPASCFQFDKKPLKFIAAIFVSAIFHYGRSSSTHRVRFLRILAKCNLAKIYDFNFKNFSPNLAKFVVECGWNDSIF